jgi:hypothetical protein
MGLYGLELKRRRIDDSTDSGDFCRNGSHKNELRSETQTRPIAGHNNSEHYTQTLPCREEILQ